MDRLTKEQRSKAMAAVKSRGNKSTEQALARILRANKITGWRRNKKGLHGSPDFVFTKTRLAVFVDGCFWHGCSKHRTIPTTNGKFWAEKIQTNKRRDRRVTKALKGAGWRVLRIWEHEMKGNPKKIIKKIAFLKA